MNLAETINDRKLQIKVTPLVLALFALQAVYGQTYESVNASTSVWDVAGNWRPGAGAPDAVPGGLNPGTTRRLEKNMDVNVNSWLEEARNISMTGKSVLRISSSQRLTIGGGLMMSSQSVLEVEPDAILIIAGNLETSGSASVVNQGSVIVMESISMAGGSDISTTQEGQFFYMGDPPTSKGGSTFNGSKNMGSTNIFDEHIFYETPVYEEIFGALPIKLDYFTAVSVGGRVELKWKLDKDINLDAFIVERAGSSVEFSTLAVIDASDPQSFRNEYSTTDESVLGGQAIYRLMARNKDGKSEQLSIVSVFNPVYLLKVKSSRQSVTFNTIPLTYSVEQYKRLAICDMTGRRVMEAGFPGTELLLELPQNLMSGPYVMLMSGQGGAILQKEIVFIK